MEQKQGSINAQKGQRGWAGEEMEMEHQREELRRRKQRTESQENPQENQLQEERRGEEKYYHAVNLDQFRNNQVGSGYQAKGVIRQRTAHDVPMNILDLSKRPENLESPTTRVVIERRSLDGRGNRDEEDDDDKTASDASSNHQKKKRKKHHKTKRQRKEKKQKSHTKAVEKYLNCKGMRDFRKELEKILSE